MRRAGEPAVRACAEADVETVLALVRADEERITGRPSRLVVGDVRDWWQRVDLPTCSWLLTAAGSADPIGVIWLEPNGSELGFGFPVVVTGRDEVLPLLVDLVEGRAAELGLARLHLAALAPDPLLERLLTGRGFREVRRFYEMAIEFDGPPPDATVPAGLVLEQVTEAGARAFHETIGEAFQDHWEHHPRPFDEWWQERTASPDHDLSWWFTVRDAERTVAAIRNVPNRNGGVYVASLGVRRDGRGQGLAKALLRHTFARAWQEGFTRITLGVDAASPTGATALYRSVGMTEELESMVWEKRLNSGSGPVAGPDR